MKAIRDHSAKTERQILIGMIVHDGVLGRIAAVVPPGKSLFAGKWANQLARWCVEHFVKYQRAPRKSVMNYFQEWSEKSRDEESVELMESFLSGLNGELTSTKGINEDFLVDLAGRLFDLVQFGDIAGRVEDAVQRGDREEAKQAWSSYVPLLDFDDDGIDLADRPSVAADLLSVEHDEVIVWPKALGRFLSPHFCRDGFISFVGPEKRGKSFWLQETVWQAIRQKRRVHYYVVGDMSRKQVLRRLGVRATRRPMDPRQRIKIPVELQLGEKHELPKVVWNPIENKEITLKARVEALQRLVGRDQVRLYCKGASAITVGDIERRIAAKARKDPALIPEVVVIDYADNLAPEPSTAKLDYRHQVNETWKALRNMSQKYHLLVVTATQAAATSYGRRLITKKDFSEDKRKNAHVTGMLGINQTAEEKKHGIYRLNWVFLRDGKWVDFQVVWTAGNLAVGCPCFISKLP